MTIVCPPDTGSASEKYGVSARAGDPSASIGRIGIIAGAGSLPLALAKALSEKGYKPFILALVGNADSSIEQFPHAPVHIGQIGRMVRLLRREGCDSIVLVGSLKRPNLFRIKIDAGFVRLLPRLIRLMRGGDDSMLRGIARFFEEQGFQVRAAHEFAPRLLAPNGVFSRISPSDAALDDIALGFEVVEALGAFDIGQAAVVSSKYVLAVEAAEGTDAMLKRCRDLSRGGFSGRKGVLVKAPKPGQDQRFDLPAIGPRTVEFAFEAGLAGIAVAAGSVLLAEQELLVEKADRLGLFLYGVSKGPK
jgi:DUF1009 family protein